MNDEEVRILKQYISALEEASDQLEQAYVDRNMENFEKIKRFMKEAQSKIKILLLK